MYQLIRSQHLPISIEKAWDFFSSPGNLRLITPDDMAFEIIARKGKGKMVENDLIDYKVRPVMNFPVKWRTLITNVQEPYCFVDKQVKGPYKFWEHTHNFTEMQGGVLMEDKINYQLPYGYLGKLLYPFVKKRLDHIFDYRTNKLNQLIKDGVLS